MYLFRLVATLVLATAGVAQVFQPVIPKAWDDRDVAGFELPLAQADRSPRYLSAAEYYSLEVLDIYRGYPVYAPGKQPAGYIETLKQKEPEVVWDAAKLRTREDWIRAGEMVFRAPRGFVPYATGIAANKDAVRALQIPATRDGILPYFQYVVRKKGVVELGIDACAICHTRVLPDGTAWYGAQGDFPWSHRGAWVRAHDERPERDRRVANQERLFYAAPWAERPDELFAWNATEEMRPWLPCNPA